MRAAIFGRAVLATMIVTGPLSAQMIWREDTLPAATVSSSIVYDSARAVTVGLFRGAGSNLATWEWDGHRWTERENVGTPAPRIYFAMAYDSVRKVVVLVGGTAVTTGPATTWEYDGSQWTTHQRSIAPRFRGRHSMTYDPIRRCVLLFGGETVNGDQSDLWEWDGSTWTQRITANGPSARSGAGFTWDTPRGLAILFGGYKGTIPNNQRRNDTWEWNGVRWLQRAPAKSPSPRGGAMLTCDTQRQRLVMWGGSSGSIASTRETWEWDGINWSQQLPLIPGQTTPTIPGQAFDAARGETILFTGFETWAWNGSAWALRGPPVSRRTGTAMTYDRMRKRCVLFGGRSNSIMAQDDTWEWNGVYWAERLPAVRPLRRMDHSMVYDSHRGVVLLFGGDIGLVWPSGRDDLWSWDGSNWVELVSSTRPTARCLSAMSFDTQRGKAVLFGGNGGLFVGETDDTWEWNGNNWIQRIAVTSPPARYGHAMAFDERRGVTVMVGGQAAGAKFNDTWEWDGFDWTQAHPRTMPGSAQAVTLAWDRARERSVLVKPGLRETWEWDGTDWVLSATAGPTDEHGMAAAYDEARGEMIWIGSRQVGSYSHTQSWIYRPTVRGAATPYGQACAGSNGLPQLDAVGAPILGNQGFHLELSSVPAQTVTVVGLSPFRAKIPLPGGCELLAAPPWIEIMQSSSASGIARASVAIPAHSALRHVDVFAQSIALDTGGALFGLGVISGGLRLLIGD